MLVNCTWCGKVYVAHQPGLCPECREAEDADFERIRAYLAEQPAAGVEEVAAATGVAPARILRFLRTGRLRLAQKSDSLTCRLCGEPIETGQVCPRCALRIRRDLAPKPPDGARMHTADRVRRQRWT